MKKRLHRAVAAAGAVFAAGLAMGPLAGDGRFGAFAQGTPVNTQQTGASGLPLPRFVSLKSDRVNVRAGPGVQYKTQWVYSRAGLPVEVVREHEGWRQVRDADGATGWVLQTLLSGRRTAQVAPWSQKPGEATPQVELRNDDNDSAPVVVRVEAGVIASVRSCDGQWCLVAIGEYRGYLAQRMLWGVYQGEIVRQ